VAPTPLNILRGPLAELPRRVEVTPADGPVEAVITPPGSKSLANRALTLALLSHGESTLRNVPEEADDIRVMLAALPALGAKVVRQSDGEFRITGTFGAPLGGAMINLHNAGTATRFLTAACALCDEPVVIDGDARMRQRPIGELVDALRTIGARVEYEGEAGFPPLRVGGGDSRSWAGEVEIGPTASSQFISAMLLIAPFCPNRLDVKLTGEVTSAPYVRMTEVMVGRLRDRVLGECAIEPDASGAAPFVAVSAVVPGSIVRVVGLGADSLQGDARFRDLIDSAVHRGHLLPMEVDLSDMPDTAMTLAAVACFAEGPSEIRGLRTLRVKETDRIAALQTELAKVGVTVEVFEHASRGGNRDEGIRVIPPAGGIDCSAGAPPVVFETYDDHRMAMAMALIGLRRPGVSIDDPGCVAKTYPGFWRDFASLYWSARG